MGGCVSQDKLGQRWDTLGHRDSSETILALTEYYEPKDLFSWPQVIAAFTIHSIY